MTASYSAISTTKPRVLHLIQRVQHRGAEIFASQLAGLLRDRGFENKVCSLYCSADQHPGDLSLGFPVSSFVASGERPRVNLHLDVRLLGTLVLKLMRERPDVVLAHGSETLKYAAMASLFARKPSIVYRNIGLASHWANSWLKVSTNRLLLSRVDRVVSASELTRRDFIDLYMLPDERVESIPIGVDLSSFGETSLASCRPRMRRGLGIRGGGIALITVGSLTPEKNPHECLRLVAELKSQGLPVHHFLVGEGPLRTELESVAVSLGVADRVHFLGVRQDIPQLMAGCDLFVLPSVTEGMPAVLIEAAAAGLPSVAYDVGGIREVVQDGVTGKVVPARNHRRLAEETAALCRSPEQRRVMGRAARQGASKFDILAIATQFEELLVRTFQSRSQGVHVPA